MNAESENRQTSRGADETYRTMVEFLASGGRLPMHRINATLDAADRTHADLVAALHTGPIPPPAPGDPCPECGGRLRVYDSKRRGPVQVRYLDCGRCGHRPEGNRQVVSRSKIDGKKPA